MASISVSKAGPVASEGPDDPRGRILTAAGQEFAEKGFEAATIRDICTLATVNVAAVNYYFGDKHRLYIESVRHAHEERSQQVPLPEWVDGTQPVKKLRDFVGNMLQRMLGFDHPPWQVRLMLREILHPTDACRELVEDYIRPHFTVLCSILNELTDGEMSPPEVRRIGLSVVGQCFLYRAAGDVVGMLIPPNEIENLHNPVDLADYVTSFCLAALGKHSPLSVEVSQEQSLSATSGPSDQDVESN